MLTHCLGTFGSCEEVWRRKGGHVNDDELEALIGKKVRKDRERGEMKQCE